MAKITLGGSPINTLGTLPETGSTAPFVQLARTDLSDITLESLEGWKVLNIFPSIDTGVCAKSVRRFNELASDRENVVVLNVSADLPFAQKRFCGAEGLERVEALSTFRSTFARDWGVEIIDGPMAGLCSRAVVVLNAENVVVYSEQVPEIAQEPDYETALASLPS